MLWCILCLFDVIYENMFLVLFIVIFIFCFVIDDGIKIVYLFCDWFGWLFELLDEMFEGLEKLCCIIVFKKVEIFI